MRKSATRLALAALLVGVAGFGTPSRANNGKVALVLTKGGFVCLPVAMAARLLNMPLVIHDSDAHP